MILLHPIKLLQFTLTSGQSQTQTQTSFKTSLQFKNFYLITNNGMQQFNPLYIQNVVR